MSNLASLKIGLTSQFMNGRYQESTKKLRYSMFQRHVYFMAESRFSVSESIIRMSKLEKKWFGLLFRLKGAATGLRRLQQISNKCQNGFHDINWMNHVEFCKEAWIHCKNCGCKCHS